MKAVAVDAKVKLEGIEVNFNSIQISEVNGNAPTASISFPATEKLMSILPRTVVEIYYRIGKEYYLLFDGELHQYTLQRTADSRSVNLQFVGNLYNWAANYIIPHEASVVSMLQRAVYGIATPLPDGSTQQSLIKYIKADDLMSPMTELANALHRLSDEPMNSVIKRAVQDLNTTLSPFYRRISSALKMSEKTLVINSEVARDIVINQATIEYITNTVRALADVNPILKVFGRMLDSFAFRLSEISAPIRSGSNVYKIIAHPISSNFSPLTCNIIFSDQIGTINYSRAIEMEPTRLVSTSPSLEIPEGADRELPINLLLAIVAPHHVLVQNIFSGGDQVKEHSRILRITQEEKFKGINTKSSQEHNRIFNAFIYSKHGTKASKEQAKDNPAKAEVLNLRKAVIEQAANLDSLKTNFEKNVQKGDPVYFRIKRAEFDFQNARYEARTANLTVDYNPYRVVGHTALIIDKNLPVILGNITNLTTIISAGGQITQNLALSHVRTIPTEKFNMNYEFLDDLFTDTFPWFEQEFNFDNIGENYYNKLTGNTRGSLKYWVPKEAQGKDLHDRFIAAVKNLIERYEASTNKVEFENYVTHRNLVTEKQYASFINSQVDTIDNIWQNELNPADNLYVQERQDRVKEIFDIA